MVAVIGEAPARRLLQGCDAALLSRTLAWLTKPDCFLVTLASPDYPVYLRETVQAPAVLYAMGRRDLLGADMFAVVGSRNPTPQGESNATAFAKALSDSGLTVVSGMALGIDAQAHHGALQGASSSVAVVGTGLDRVYPARHHELARTLATQGLLLSEFALGTAPLPGNFPRRNRIISGLARGCLVVEASLNSGSLLTARLATAQGRDVFAIPGSIHSPLSKGCHALIKEGAKLVENVGDILDELGWMQGTGTDFVRNEHALINGGTRSSLLELMGFDPISVDQLTQASGLPPGEVSAELLRLELDGNVVTLPGGLHQRVI